MKVLERIADVLAATMVIMVGIAMGAIIVALLTLAYRRFIDDVTYTFLLTGFYYVPNPITPVYGCGELYTHLVVLTG